LHELSFTFTANYYLLESMKDAAQETYFGFQPVEEHAKERMVQSVFSHVASRYDLMNDLMSAGLHHGWKEQLIDRVRPTPTMHLLDVAGGTGDIAFRYLKRGGGRVTLADLNPEMLEVGRGRAIDMNLDADRLQWNCANAESLPFDDTSFDCYTISFGIRNVTHIDAALREAYRVLRYGGHFLCLEFSMPSNPILRKLYDAYSFNVIPSMGAKITGDKDSYQYLVESIRQFPEQKRFAEIIKDAGFQRVHYDSLQQGIVTIHSAWKI
jgi:demethylmenaquinone methyltransferase / 2-methoxy-6-polyprenyl-1,4-benzoquinol methylase